jgi:uroporphyrin-3 C-methyltransferase
MKRKDKPQANQPPKDPQQQADTQPSAESATPDTTGDKLAEATADPASQATLEPSESSTAAATGMDSAQNADDVTKIVNPDVLPVPTDEAQPADGGSDDANSEAEVADAPPPSEKKGGRAAMIVAVIALLLALAGLGGGYYLYTLSQTQQSTQASSDAAWRSEADKLAQQVASVKNAAESRAAAVSAEAAQARDAVAAQISELVGEQVSTLDERLTGVADSLSQTQEYALRSQRGWLLAEVEYLFRIAIQRVLLAGDLDSAAAALRAADARLHELGDVNYLPVRVRLADEIAALRGVDRPDVEGTVFELVRLGRRADDLPLLGVLAKAEGAAQAKPEAIDVMPEGSFWDAVQKFIVVRRNDVQVDLSVSPTPDQMSRAETLRLQLQAAQLAAMRRDEASYRNYMSQAVGYVEKEYQTSDPRVQRFLEDLVALGQRNIVPHVDTLGEALQMLRDTNARYAEPSPLDEVIQRGPDAEAAATTAPAASEAPAEATAEAAQVATPANNAATAPAESDATQEGTAQ